MIGATLPLPVMLVIERAINQRIRRDDAARQSLPRLNGRLFEMSLRDPAVRFFITITPEGILLLRDTEDSPDATIRASSLGLLRAGRAAHKMEALFAGDIQIQGDQDAAQLFLRLLGDLDSDPFAALAERIGVAPAGLIERKVEQIRQQVQIWRRTRQIESADFLVFERAVLIDRAEMQQWLDEVDALRDQVDQLAMRIDTLNADRILTQTAPQASTRESE
ncbi:MAG: ubiquinone biosynthesis accessory factor UbiJ [Halothiobacillus sp.]